MCSKFLEGRCCPETWLSLLEDLPSLPSLPYSFGSSCSANSSLHVQTPLPLPVPSQPSQSFQVQLLLIFPTRGKVRPSPEGSGQDRAVNGLIHCCPATSSGKSTPSENCHPPEFALLLLPLARSQRFHVI